MSGKLIKFELFILRPLWALFIFSIFAFVFKTMWWWLIGSASGLFYLGIIGSNLHPLQSAKFLAQGPLENPEARVEAAILPIEVKRLLLGHACTRVGILFGASVAIVSFAGFGLSWYLAVVAGWTTTMLSGAGLKMAFEAP
jgi:hypothetical protein